MPEPILEKCPPPTALDKHTLKAYAEKCGKQVAIEWVEKETGVKVGKCAQEAPKDIPECVANNYSVSLDLVNDDGSVNWENVAHDAGAVGGIAVCVAMGASAAALPLCAKIGGVLADITVALGKTAYEIGSQVLDFFFGSDNPKGVACTYKYAPVGPIIAAKYAALFFKSPKTWGWFPADELLGQQIFGTQGSADPKILFINHASYWSRLLILRGLASASAAVADDMSRKTGSSFAQALAVLNPVAPRGWTELARPQMSPTVSGLKAPDFTTDYVMNVGGLLSVVLQPNAVWTYSGEVSKGQVIVPRWQEITSWTGVPSSFESSWYALMFVEACDYQTTVWASVTKPTEALQKLKALPPAQLIGSKKDGPKGRTAQQAYWLYSVPKSVDSFVRTANDDAFKKLVELWRISLSQDLDKKLEILRRPASKSSTAETVVKVGGGAALLWTLLKYLKVM